MTILFANNANTTIAGSITNVATSVNLATGSGALFPSPTGGDYFVGTFTDAATGLIREIVHCTGRSGDVLTIVRAQEGTSAVAWTSGDFFANQMTAGTASAFIQSVTAGVTSFNSRTGAVTLTSGDVTAALGYTPATSTAAVAPGAIVWFANSTPPAGYLECNGSLLSTTTYSALFGQIGYTFGGSGLNFQIPDLRGQFVRGWDDGRSVDSGRAFGSTQLDQLQGHYHNWAITTSGTGGISSGFASGGDNTIYGNPGVTGSQQHTSDPVNDGTNGTPRIGTETRPTNVALLPVIKY